MEDPSRFLRLRDVEQLTGLSKSSVYRLEARGELPSRLKLSARASAWIASEVQAWQQTVPSGA